MVTTPVSGGKIPLVFMSNLTYYLLMSPKDKPLVWMADVVKTPPMSRAARVEAGHYLRQLQQGVALSLPISRPMPVIGARCHELRINDAVSRKNWRIFYRTDSDAIVVLHYFNKTTRATPQDVIDLCQKRLALYDED